MKKILAIALVLSMLAVAGCGAAAPAPASTAPASNAPSSEAPAAPATAAALKVGMGSLTSVKSSKPATAEDGAKSQADTTMAVVALDESGKIVTVSIDVVQAKVAYDTKGALKTNVADAVKTKKQLGEEYGMRKASAIGKEWFEQIAAFEEYITGKTIDEIKAMPTKVKDENHPKVPDVAELASSCTMNVGDYIDAVALAASNAK